MSLVPAAALRVDGVEYAFAEEYHGPLITGKLPRALPINVDGIPAAAVVSQLPDKLSLPIVQPIPASTMTKKFAKDSKFFASETSVSPTSVIAFESQDSGPIVDESIGIELAPGSETTVTVSLVNASGEVSSSSYSEKPTGEFSSRIGVTTSHDHCCELLNGLGSSGSLAFSESFEQSRELSRSCRQSINSNGYKESLDFNHDWASNESVLSMCYPSSRVSSLKIGECSNDSEIDNKRDHPVVTLQENESSEDILEHEGLTTNRSKREPSIKVQKGVCYRCFKGNRFTEKEICVVCDAKYCRNCVLRAMGSMPEGRKCVTCIGFPIDESKRITLGKCSRILKRLLNDLEIQQMMRSEKSCQANQLPPDRVYVNSMPLCHEELSILQSCSNPPKKLKPGNYWYDKVSGLWGKEGQKPSHIITPHLNVGPPIKVDASNGNTQVYMNGREITKSELRMLQLQGVQCAGNPHFWVNDDGSYQEEGQKNTKGYIWGKAGTKLICAVLSLPVPSKACNIYGHNASITISRKTRDHLEQRAIQKLLLIGCSGSGTSTIFKQAKILYRDVPFTDEEREHIKLLIQSNVYGYLGILLEGREKFEEESLNESSKCQCLDELRLTGQKDGNVEKSKYSIPQRLKSFSDWVLNIMVTGSLESVFPASAREYAPLIDELWSNAAIQATFERRNELEMLPSVASYFLERAVNISRDDYEPSDLDILYAEGVTSSNGLACMDFVFPEATYNENLESCELQDSLRRYQLITVHAQGIGENCKWLEMLEDVRIVLFCVSLIDYDQFVINEDGNQVNKMVLSRNFFESIVTHPTFDQMDFLLLLNKFDSFETKIELVDLTTCEWFDDFNPVMTRSHNISSNSNFVHKAPSLGQIGFHYIAIKFKKLFGSLKTNRKLYVSMMNGLDPNSVDQALRYGKEIVKWDEERPNFGLNEYSIYSTEPSSLTY